VCFDDGLTMNGRTNVLRKTVESKKTIDEATDVELVKDNWFKLHQLTQRYDRLGPLARRELETRCLFQNGFVGSGRFNRDAYRILTAII